MAKTMAKSRQRLVDVLVTEGATSAEYALLAAFIAVVLVVSIKFYGDAIVSLFRTYPELISS